MKSWQAVSMGIVLGIAATLSLGALGVTPVPIGPYLEVSDHEIINTAHIEYAHIGPYSTANHVDGWQITLRNENNHEQNLTFEDETKARGVWKNLRNILGVANQAQAARE